MSTQLVMPSLGESVIEGTVTKWLVHEGDMVLREQPVVSVATDKADTDVPATQAGRVVRIFAPEGATVKVGDPLCELDASAAAAAPPPAKAGATVPAPPPEGMTLGPESPEPSSSKRKASTSSPSPAAPAALAAAAVPGADNGALRAGRTSPVVRKLALEHGVNLEQVEGS